MSTDAVVYVVDDDQSVRKALARLIRSVGLDVETFGSATEFLERAPVDRPACLVLDVRLPGPSGLDVQAALAQARRPIAIVFITGHGDVPMSVRAMKGGAVDFIEKPFNESDLLDAVRRALEVARRVRVERAERGAIQARLETLTPREREVLALLVTGLLNKQIGARLGVAETTIKVHRGRIMQKTQASSLAELVRMTEKIGLSSHDC